jgi:2,3-bisphosphoglycerate-independent phosphoglycerate mutase
MAERYEYQNINKKRRKDGKFARRFVSTKKQPMTPEVQEMIMEQTQKQLARQIAKEVRSKGFGVIIYKN